VWNIYIPVTSASDIAAVLFVLYSSSVDNKFVLSSGTHGFCFVDKSCFCWSYRSSSCIDLTFCFKSLLEILLNILTFIPINCAMTHLKVFFQKPFLTENIHSSVTFFWLRHLKHVRRVDLDHQLVLILLMFMLLSIDTSTLLIAKSPSMISMPYDKYSV